MTSKELLEEFMRMLAEHWEYTSGAAQKGNVDCSGAFVYAFRQHGLSIYHGSNRIARTEVVELLPISAAQPGMAAFKTREPSDSRYALPSGYKSGGKYYNGDLRDFYHIGLVGEDGNILNAQSSATGFVSSPIKTWACVARLKKVEYTDGDATGTEPPADTATDSGVPAIVVAESGKTVNLRVRGDLKAMIVERVAVGSTVTVLDETDDWALVNSGKNVGFMRKKFLQYKSSTSGVSLEEVIRRIELLEERVAALEGGVG